MNSSNLDKILCDGDTLYRQVINRLKAQGKSVHSLLSLEEMPDDFEVEIGKFVVEKHPIVSGILVDTHENLGLPTLHNALHSAFTSTSGLLTIGAICSAIFKKKNLYMFFDSHSHGENGLSSADGRSILVSFSCLDDLVSYLYVFYDNMRIDMSLQFDFLPVTFRKYDQKQNCQEQNHKPNSLKFSESIADRSTDNTVESIAETLPKVSESAEAELQLPVECFAGSSAEIFAIELNVSLSILLIIP